VIHDFHATIVFVNWKRAVFLAGDGVSWGIRQHTRTLRWKYSEARHHYVRCFWTCLSARACALTIRPTTHCLSDMTLVPRETQLSRLVAACQDVPYRCSRRCTRPVACWKRIPPC